MTNETLNQATPEALPEAPSDAAPAEVKAVVEALIFASPEPITPKMLYKLLAEEPKEDVLAAVEALKADYENRPGAADRRGAGGYQIVTRPDLHEWVRRLFHERSTQKLTVQGLETLAVIAYKQPITALEITEIRGVNTTGVLSTLLERHLIKIVGRKNVVGRPFLYATTKEFLIRFGLKDLKDLPKIEDMAEALGFEPPAGLIEQTPARRCAASDRGGPLLVEKWKKWKEWKKWNKTWVKQAGTSPPLVPMLRAARWSQLFHFSGASPRHSPGFSRRSAIGPIRVRLSDCTGWPTASHMRRT